MGDFLAIEGGFTAPRAFQGSVGSVASKRKGRGGFAGTGSGPEDSGVGLSAVVADEPSPAGLARRLRSKRHPGTGLPWAPVLPMEKRALPTVAAGSSRDENGQDPLISSLPAGQSEMLGRDGIAGGGTMPKLESGVEAVRAGARNVHLIDGRMPHSLLLEIFTKKGVGTEIISDEQ